MTKASLALVVGCLAGLTLRPAGRSCEPGIHVVEEGDVVAVSASCPNFESHSTEAFTYGLSVERIGPSGIATSRQSGRLAAIASVDGPRPRVELNASPGDTLRISLTISRGDHVVAAADSMHVIGQPPPGRTSL